MMKTSHDGREFIKAREGVRLSAYLDSAGIPTVGVGHTGRGVHLGMKITQDQVDELLTHDLESAERCVNRHVTVPLSQQQFDALVSFTFNLGCGALMHSTLLRKLNAGDYNGAAEEFHKWCHAGGRELAGLVTRRNLEKEMFLS